MAATQQSKTGCASLGQRPGAILGYAGIAATVGLILRVIEDRLGFVGRWITALLGAAFTIATSLTVPVLVSRDVGPVDAVKESALLLKKTWGENLVGNGGMGLAFALGYVAIIAFMITLLVVSSLPESPAFVVAVLGLGALAMVGLALIHAALQGIYAAALYRYATGQPPGAIFSDDALSAAFRTKRS